MFFLEIAKYGPKREKNFHLALSHLNAKSSIYPQYKYHSKFLLEQWHVLEIHMEIFLGGP